MGIAEFLTNVIPVICQSFRLMMKWNSVKSIVTRSVDIEMIRHEFSPLGEVSDTDSVDNTSTEIITRNNDGFVAYGLFSEFIYALYFEYYFYFT